VVFDIRKEIIENIFEMGVRIVFMGTSEFAVPILESLVQNLCQVVAVYTQPDKPAGRKQELTPSPVKRLAMAHQISVVQPRELKSAAVKELASFKPELIVVAAFGRILPQEVLSLPEFGCLNIHPSLLPRHRGPSPVANALLLGDEFTGVTIMLMEAGLDSGPILAQRKVAISPQDIAGSLTAKLAVTGAQLLMETLPKWLDGKIKPQPQDEGQATYSKLLTKEDGELDWRLSAEDCWRRVRAYNPWPSCYTWWQGKRSKIHEAIPLSEGGNGEIGKVVALSEPAPTTVGVVAGRGILGLCRVQLEGRQEMSISEFVRGQRGFVGSFLP
jgi:methionyl-tRNA formyltransferase